MRSSVHFHSQRSLSARGQLLNTFAGMLWCLALALLALGVYLIHDQFADPIQAPAAGLILGALLVGTAITLLFAWLQPARKLHTPVIAERRAMPHSKEGIVVLARSSCRALPWNEGRQEPQHSRYVDHMRIRP